MINGAVDCRNLFIFHALRQRWGNGMEMCTDFQVSFLHPSCLLLYTVTVWLWYHINNNTHVRLIILYHTSDHIATHAHQSYNWSYKNTCTPISEDDLPAEVRREMPDIYVPTSHCLFTLPEEIYRHRDVFLVVQLTKVWTTDGTRLSSQNPPISPPVIFYPPSYNYSPPFHTTIPCHTPLLCHPTALSHSSAPSHLPYHSLPPLYTLSTGLNSWRW